MSRAAALVIGNEILTGKVQDENSYALAQVLFERGVNLTRIEVVPDDVDIIAESIRKLSGQVDYLFSSGGIGPTHDDLTYEAVAKAFSRKLAYHEPTLLRLKEYHDAFAPHKVFNQARQKMAFLPTPCEILHIEGLWVPVVQVENLYVLPGVPQLFKRMLEGVKDHFHGEKMERVIVYTQRSEGDIAEDLSTVQNTYPKVAIGSYPRYGHSSYQVMVTFEGIDTRTVHEAAKRVEDAIEGFRDIPSSSGA